VRPGRSKRATRVSGVPAQRVTPRRKSSRKERASSRKLQQPLKLWKASPSKLQASTGLQTSEAPIPVRVPEIRRLRPRPLDRCPPRQSVHKTRRHPRRPARPATGIIPSETPDGALKRSQTSSRHLERWQGPGRKTRVPGNANSSNVPARHSGRHGRCVGVNAAAKSKSATRKVQTAATRMHPLPLRSEERDPVSVSRQPAAESAAHAAKTA